ncbi:stealth family protein [Solitalea sp. MAHUQ-68]|uniref:Stealth family protein n=1 Tax=Solitalea agri TaxID=2953739 RepID=A0A9X2JDF9_9SPHI|nr:stealth family protein [Solitalea agri]MCO4292870.1 stealth family protein [Solitalea agri]
MSKQDFEIDLVYLWVNGNDPQWLARKNAFLGIDLNDTERNCKGRYVNNDELRFSLRSVEKHAPWIRKIFIVTDGQTPEWLDTTNSKIQIVDHKEILPPESLPCYNSNVLEYFIYKIPGLSEHFLFSNDDMFFNASLSPDFFFANDGYPIVRLINKPFGKWRFIWKKLNRKKLSIYREKIFRAAQLVEKMFGKYYSAIPHHNIDAYRKSDYQKSVEQIFSKEISPTISHHLRNTKDIHRSAFMFYSLAVKNAHLKYITPSESYVVKMHLPKSYVKFEGQMPKLFCMNDSEYVSDHHRVKAKEYLANHYPSKSLFEK